EQLRGGGAVSGRSGLGHPARSRDPALAPDRERDLASPHGPRHGAARVARYPRGRGTGTAWPLSRGRGQAALERPDVERARHGAPDAAPCLQGDLAALHTGVPDLLLLRASRRLEAGVPAFRGASASGGGAGTGEVPDRYAIQYRPSTLLSVHGIGDLH